MRRVVAGGAGVLDNETVVPLMWLPRAWAVGERVRDLRLLSDGTPDLSDASLEGAEVTLRQKMLLMLALTVMGVVAALGWTGSVRVRHVFEAMDRQQTDMLVGQFQREFNQRASDTAATMDRMAASDVLRRIAFELNNGGDTAPYLTVALPLAQEYRLDYLELVAHDGSIISSLQWTARFGYKEPAIAAVGKPAFLKQEDLPDGTSQIGLFATRAVNGVRSAAVPGGWKAARCGVPERFFRAGRDRRC